MAGDVRSLMDHLNIDRADMMGYSMGGHPPPISDSAVRSAEQDHSRRIGMGLIEGGGPGENVAAARSRVAR
jgi:pimeloyl-ACP methyl ester carboxylesterase